MKPSAFDQINDYVLRKTKDMSIFEVQALKDHLESMLEAKLTELRLPKDDTLKLLGMAQHHDRQRNINMVKANINGMTQSAIASQYKISVTAVARVIGIMKNKFIIYQCRNYLQPPLDIGNPFKKMTEDTLKKFNWFLDHFLIIEGYEYNKDIHIPASLKPIDVMIDDSPLHKKVKMVLKCNGYTNMAEVAKLSNLEIYNLPHMSPNLYKSILSYFYIYHPKKQVKDYEFVSHIS